MPDISEVRAETEQNRFEFLKNDLNICFTYADPSRTELCSGDSEAAARTLARAEEGYATIVRFLANVKDPENRTGIETRLNGLRATLDEHRRYLRPSGLQP